VADPLNNSSAIVTLKGITPTMETMKHKERKHQRVQQCLRVEKVSFLLLLSSPSFLPLLMLDNLAVYFPSAGPCTGSTLGISSQRLTLCSL